MADSISEQISKIKNMKCPANKSQIANYLKEYKLAMKNLSASYRAINGDNDSKSIERLKRIKNLSKSPVSKNNKDADSKDYNYHEIFNDVYQPIITGFDSNLDDKYFPLLYNSQRSPLFNDKSVYVNTDNNDEIFGNVFIKLSGNNGDDIEAGDFAIADEAAIEAGVFEGDRPAGYIWHHVFMGWANKEFLNWIVTDSDNYGDGMSMDNFLYEFRRPLPDNYADIYESLQPFHYYDKEIGKIQTIDASGWTNCLVEMGYDPNWVPDLDYSLVQLVKKELILGTEYLDSCDQFIIYCDNAEGGYQGDYTENDCKRFAQT